MTEKKLSLRRLAAVLLSALMIVSFMPILSDQEAYAGTLPGTAYAVLEDGTLYFIRSKESPTGTAPNQKIRDVAENEYTGTVYTGFETTAYTDAASVPWHADRDKITKLSGGKNGCHIGAGNYCVPASTAHWFEGCGNLVSVEDLFFDGSQGVGTTDLSQASSTADMFRGCKSLRSDGQINMTIPTAADASGMFEGCSKLGNIYVNGDKIQNASSMFKGARI